MTWKQDLPKYRTKVSFCDRLAQTSNDQPARGGGGDRPGQGMTYKECWPVTQSDGYRNPNWTDFRFRQGGFREISRPSTVVRPWRWASEPLFAFLAPFRKQISKTPRLAARRGQARPGYDLQRMLANNPIKQINLMFADGYYPNPNWTDFKFSQGGFREISRISTDVRPWR